jgi:hypothetical protein
LCDRCRDSGKVIEGVMAGVYRISLCDCQNAAQIKQQTEERMKRLKRKLDEAEKLMGGM